MKEEQKEKYVFQLIKHFVFSFFLGTPPIFKPHNFLFFLFVFNDLKLYRSAI
jgi:hypothetical protein